MNKDKNALLKIKKVIILWNPETHLNNIQFLNSVKLKCNYFNCLNFSCLISGLLVFCKFKKSNLLSNF